MTMHNILYPNDEIDKLYVARKKGKGFAGTEDSVDPSIQGL